MNGSDYEKNKEGESTIYILTESPIAKLTLTDSSLEIEINKDKVFCITFPKDLNHRSAGSKPCGAL